MGHNRGGDNRKARLRRRKREMERLAKKAKPAAGQGGEARPASAEPAK